jgi:hypothetical protein
MICLSDLSPLMQRTIAKGISFMVSQSGIERYYNLYFAKHILGSGCKSVHLNYHQDDGQVIQYADKEHPIIKFDSVDDVVEYVVSELIK